MQIREQGRKIQCIRSTYDPAIKRSRQTVVASLPLYCERPVREQLPELTDDEAAQLITWWEARRERWVARSARVRVGMLGQGLEDMVMAVELAADGTLSAEQAAQAWEQIARLQKALKKAGHPRPKRPAPAAKAAALDGQGDLLSE